MSETNGQTAPPQDTKEGPPSGAYPPQQEGAPPGAYPPQQGGPPPGAYPPPAQQQATTTTVVTSQQVVTTAQFRDIPVQCRCPNCNNDVTSNLTLVNGMMVYIGMLVLILVGLWWGCCLIPLCIPALKDVEHTCPVCNYQLGKYERVK